MANQTIANLIHETNFDSVYQQGQKYSMFVITVDEFACSRSSSKRKSVLAW